MVRTCKQPLESLGKEIPTSVESAHVPGTKQPMSDARTPGSARARAWRAVSGVRDFHDMLTDHFFWEKNNNIQIRFMKKKCSKPRHRGKEAYVRIKYCTYIYIYNKKR